jgi:hypothetical protein
MTRFKNKKKKYFYIYLFYHKNISNVIIVKNFNMKNKILELKLLKLYY